MREPVVLTLPDPAGSACTVAGEPVAFDLVHPISGVFTPEYLERYGLLPFRTPDGELVLATWLDRPDVQALDDMHEVLGGPGRLVRLPEPEVRAAIRRVYAGESETAEGVIAGFRSDPRDAALQELPIDDLRSLANEAPVVKLVTLLLLEALESRASDVHLESYVSGLRVRYRIDGVLQNAPSPPAQLTPAVVSRLKIMAELDIAERRLPQDGRIRLRLTDRQVDVRVSTVPTLHGESIVLRLLDRESGRVGLAELGMGEATLRNFEEVIQRPHGIVLATGPTGSGKTTTLYAAVDRIRTGREKILTVEDPVEYELAGVPQIPVNEKVGVTFAAALRSLLRQDPDVLLVGEIRDEQTAEIAIHAALTGHLVLSTLHTNDAPGALTRLVDLGIAPYLVGSTVEAVLAQRLVRRNCTGCSEPVPASEDWLSEFGDAVRELDHITRGRGCDDCRGTGYRGRVGIYELLIVDGVLRKELPRLTGAGELRSAAIDRGMSTLRADGLRLIRAGVTTPEEVLRVTRG
jgi:type II secretion system protein E